MANRFSLGIYENLMIIDNVQKFVATKKLESMLVKTGIKLIFAKMFKNLQTIILS